jgi:hypothetical protein
MALGSGESGPARLQLARLNQRAEPQILTGSPPLLVPKLFPPPPLYVWILSFMRRIA